MIVVMEKGASEKQIRAVAKAVEKAGFSVRQIPGEERVVIACIGIMEAEKAQVADRLRMLEGVKEVVKISTTYKLAARECSPAGSKVKIGSNLYLGGKQIIVIAGPCSAESEKQFRETAETVKEAGASALRGGAFKPRTNPYSFRGLGEEGLKIMRQIGDKLGMPIVTEVMEIGQLPLVSGYANVLQVGARNMQNYNLLEAVGNNSLPVLLKRGMSATLDELLLAAEYILSCGNPNVILCERGIRGFDNQYTRNILDVMAVPVLKKLTHLPVIVDPSHATGHWWLVPDAAKAAIAAGADGLLIEVHINPKQAKSDGPQQLTPSDFKRLMKELQKIAEAVGRTL